jgi:hypothetical protein
VVSLERLSFTRTSIDVPDGRVMRDPVVFAAGVVEVCVGVCALAGRGGGAEV